MGYFPQQAQHQPNFIGSPATIAQPISLRRPTTNFTPIIDVKAADITPDKAEAYDKA